MGEDQKLMPLQRVVLVALCSTITGLGLAPVAQADHSDCRKSVETKYSRYYYATAHKLGKRVPGRNIRKFGLTNKRRAQCHDLNRSLRTFQRWLAPPVGGVGPGDQRPTSGRTAPTSTGGQYAIPRYIVMCESKGSYSARNGQYYGAYQIGDFHWSAECKGLDKSPAGQDACAGILWSRYGSSPWSCA